MAKGASELKLKNRTAILAHTRAMMRKDGPDNLSMRRLAASCNVSVPTIYNRFKNKHDLMSAAVDEVFRLQLEQIDFAESWSNLERMLHFSDKSCEMILANPEFSRWMFKENPETPSRSSLLIAKSFYRNCLKTMQQEAEIITALPVDFLGDRVYYRIRSTAFEWALGQVSDSGFKHLRRCELALLLLGVSSNALKEQLQRILEEEAHLAE